MRITIYKKKKLLIINGQMKKISLCKIRFYTEPGSYVRSQVKVDLDLYAYATKSDLKG